MRDLPWSCTRALRSPSSRDTPMCALLHVWSRDVAGFLGNATDLQRVAVAQRSLVGMVDYFRDVLAAHRRAPRDNLLERLLETQRQHPDFSDDDLLANCAALIFAGHETTTHLIANGLYAFFTHPQAWNVIGDDPDRIPSAVEECLRFESPVQRLSRVALSPLSLGDQTLPEGCRVIVLIGAANRDPRVFPDPDRFDINRSNTAHALAFGHGRHLCSGAALGRLEASRAFAAIRARCSALELAEDESPRYQHNLGLRALERLPLRLIPK